MGAESLSSRERGEGWEQRVLVHSGSAEWVEQSILVPQLEKGVGGAESLSSQWERGEGGAESLSSQWER